MFAALNSFLTRAVSGYFLNKSLRFRGSASAYLNRTPAVSGNRRTFTISYWIKRGTLGTSQYVFSAGSGTTESTFFDIAFDNNGASFDASGAGTWTTSAGSTTAVFRDPAAWYHFVWAVDTTQALASDRSKIYVNGVLQTSLAIAVNLTQNADLAWNNSGVVHYIGARIDGGPRSFFDGEMAEINSVDGQALAPTAFGATGANSQWLPKAYTGTYGTNGFYLPFTNTASTSTLVADSSGNANNWTPNNISLTAGSTYDSLTDVPTLTSTTVANYCVINPLVKNACTITNGNLTASGPVTYTKSVVCSIGMTTGLFYWESVFTRTSSTDGGVNIGIVPPIWDNGSSAGSPSVFPGKSADSYGVDGNSGQKVNNLVFTAYGSAFASGDIIMIAYDATNGKFYAGKNGTWFNSGDPATGTNAAFTGLTGTYLPAYGVAYDSGSSIVNVNFGQQPFTYTPPTGFVAINTFNIAAGTVTTSGTFTGNLSTDGPFVFLNGTPTAMTINGNAVTFGTHADKLANGFKVRSSSASYNASGSNTYVATTVAEVLKYENAQPNP